MISKLTNIFKKTDLDEKNAFRKKVIVLLQQKFPNYVFTDGEHFDEIAVGEIKLGLTNLRAKFLLSSQTSNDLKTLVEEQFGHLPQTFNLVEKLETQETWESVKALVLPQIMPIEFAEKFQAMSLPLGDEVAVGCVIDDEKAYRYVIENDLKNWQVSAETVFQAGLENLAGKTENIEMMIAPLPVGLVVVNTSDSFDAARILLPDLRGFFAAQIGSPFFVGIPNRDFLICYSAQTDEETLKNIRNQIATDYDERPYPLSKNIFIVDGKNEIKQLDLPESKKDKNLPNLN